MHARYCPGCNEQVQLMDEDHIIPQAIGGKITAFLCKKCHKKIYSADTALVKSLHPMASLCNVKRGRGQHPLVRVKQVDTGIDFEMDSENAYRSKPEVKILFDQDGRCQPYIKARSKDELEEILRGIKKKYKQLGEVSCGSEMTPLDLVEYENVVGGRQFMRSVAKSAFLYLATRLTRDRVSSEIFSPIREFIFEDVGQSLVSFNYVHTSFMVDKYHPMHSIAIHFDSRSRNIVGYVQYFNVFRFSVLIAREFTWNIALPDMKYCINPIDGYGVQRFDFVLKDIVFRKCLFPAQSIELVLDEIAKGYSRLSLYCKGLYYSSLEFIE